MHERAISPRRVGRFVRDRWLLAAFAPLFVIFGTLVHEGAHALVVVAQGGTVVDLRVLPSVGPGGVSFGHTLHDGRASPAWVAIAPAIAWVVIGAAAVALVARIRARRVAEGVLLALVVVPMVDLSFAFAGLFLARPSMDLHRVLHGRETLAGVAMSLVFPSFGRWCWIRWRAIAPGALSATEFTLGYVALLAAPWALLAAAG
jgi:hypothetical protein